MTEDQKTTVIGYVTTFNSDIAEGDVLDLVVDTVDDRVQLYLNDITIADSLLRVIAQVVVSVYKRTESSAASDDRSVSSVTDNGQTVSYHQKPKQYLTSTTDDQLFTGFERLLAPYRRVHVIKSTGA